MVRSWQAWHSCETRSRLGPAGSSNDWAAAPFGSAQVARTPISSKALSIAVHLQVPEGGAGGRLRSLDVVAGRAQIAGIVGEAFLARYPPAPDDACLQIRDHQVDVGRAQRAGSRVQIVRRGAERRAVARADLIGALVECRHVGPGTSAADRLLERRRIEPARAQIGPRRRLIAFLVAVRKGAVAIGASG